MQIISRRLWLPGMTDEERRSMRRTFFARPHPTRVDPDSGVFRGITGQPQNSIGVKPTLQEPPVSARLAEMATGALMQRAAKERLLASLPYLFLLTFPLVLFEHMIFARSQSFFVYPDMVNQFYPWYQKLAQSIHHGYLPIWDANVYGGHSFVGEFQTGTFYPLNLLWVTLFGTASGIHTVYLDLLIALHFFLASLGMYFLCRRWGLSMPASLAGGLVFAYSGAVAYRAAAQSCIFFGLALLPFAVYFAARYFDTSHKRYLAFAGIVLGLQLLAGHVQPFFHTALIALVYLLIPQRQTHGEYLARIKQFPLRALLMMGVALLTAAPQLYLSLQYLGNAYRWVSAPNPIGPGQKVPFDVYAYQNIITPHDVLSILSVTKYSVADGNTLYVGLLPLLLVGMLLLVPRLRRATATFSAHRVFLAGIAGLAVLVALGHYTIVSDVIYHLPLGTQVREPGRYIILFHFALAALVAIAVQSLAKHPPTLPINLRNITALILVVPAGVLATGYLPGTQNITGADIHQVVIVIIFLALLLVLPRPKVSVPLTALLLLALSIFINSDTFIPTVQAGSSVEQQFARNRIIDYLERLYPKYRVIDDAGALPDNIGDVYKIQTKLGHGATIYKPYFDFINQNWSEGSRVNDLLSIRYIVTRRTLGLTLVMDDPATGLKLYERKTYYPRVLFADELGLTGKLIESRHQFDIVDYGDLSQTYRIRAPRPETVIFSEVWYPGWRAYVDGKRVSMLKADIAGYTPLLREINVPRGRHSVQFKYLGL